MVCDYETGDPIRSYVRVPLSGRDKDARPLCCDLSRVSTLAEERAPIVQSHIQDPQPPTATSETCNSVDETLASTKVKKQANKRCCQEETEDTAKRALLENKGSISSVSISCTAGCENLTISVGTQTNEPSNDIVRERNKLREQKIILERRIAIFTDLFRNKERLIRLINAL